MTGFNTEELAQVAKSAREAVEQVKKSHVDLDGRVAKLQEEIASGKADAVTKAAFQDAVVRVEKAEKALDAANDQIGKLMARAESAFKGRTVAKSLGQLAAESEAAKNYKGGMVELCNMSGPLFAKANVTSADDSAGALIQPYRVPGVLMDPDTPLTIRDIFAAVSISTNAIEWVQEKLFTNNAGPQAAEGAAKNESGITFEKKSSAVETIAHWIPASRQVLADAPQLRGIIDGKLRTGLKLKEDEMLMFGDGLNGNLLGLVPQATAYSNVGLPAGANMVDHLRWAFLQVAKAKYPATFAALSLEDWALIQMIEDRRWRVHLRLADRWRRAAYLGQARGRVLRAGSGRLPRRLEPGRDHLRPRGRECACGRAACRLLHQEHGGHPLRRAPWLHRGAPGRDRLRPVRRHAVTRNPPAWIARAGGPRSPSHENHQDLRARRQEVPRGRLPAARTGRPDARPLPAPWHDRRCRARAARGRRKAQEDPQGSARRDQAGRA